MLSRPESCCCRQFRCGLGKYKKNTLTTFQRSSFQRTILKRRNKLILRAYNQKNGQKSNGFGDNSSPPIDKLLQIGKEAQPMGQPKDSIQSVTNPYEDKDYQTTLFNTHHNLFIKDPQRTYLNTHMVLAETKFRNRHRLARLMSTILQRKVFSQNDSLKEFPTYIVKALLQYHPFVEEKQLYDIQRIYTASPPPPHSQQQKCFWIERSDGSIEDVSYRKCITHQTTEHGTFIRAAKFQILSLYNEYRKNLFKSGHPVHCSKTGVELKSESECITTCLDDPFEYQISQFVHRYRIDVKSVQYIIQTNLNGKKTVLISSAGLRMQLDRYFRDNVRLGVVHKWYYIKQLNQIVLFCTHTSTEDFIKIDNWKEFGRIKFFNNPQRKYFNDEGNYNFQVRQNRRDQQKFSQELERTADKYLNQIQKKQSLIQDRQQQQKIDKRQQSQTQAEQIGHESQDQIESQGEKFQTVQYEEKQQQQQNQQQQQILQQQQEESIFKDQTVLNNLEQIWGIDKNQSSTDDKS